MVTGPCCRLLRCLALVGILCGTVGVVAALRRPSAVVTFGVVGRSRVDASTFTATPHMARDHVLTTYGGACTIVAGTRTHVITASTAARGWLFAIDGEPLATSSTTWVSVLTECGFIELTRMVTLMRQIVSGCRSHCHARSIHYRLGAMIAGLAWNAIEIGHASNTRRSGLTR